MVSAAVEGTLDEAVLRRLTRDIGLPLGPVHGKEGKAKLLERLPAYNAAARHSPWIVVVDLDQDSDCAPPFRERHLPAPAESMCFRIAVRQIEAWLLADIAGISNFLSVPSGRVPPNPEAVIDPKSSVVDLARRSRRREIRESLVPTTESGRKVGPGYNAHLTEFVNAMWNPPNAARLSESLARCLRRLSTLAAALNS